MQTFETTTHDTQSLSLPLPPLPMLTMAMGGPAAAAGAVSAPPLAAAAGLWSGPQMALESSPFAQQQQLQVAQQWQQQHPAGSLPLPPPPPSSLPLPPPPAAASRGPYRGPRSRARRPPPPCNFGSECFRSDCRFSHPPAGQREVSALTAAMEAAVAALPPPVADPAAPWRTQSKTSVWNAHPREDSYGCLVVAHADPSVPLSTAAALQSASLSGLRFLLVQRATTGAWHNVISELQESPSVAGAKAEWWVRREAERLTDGELDALGHDFSSVWLDPIRVSDSWRVDFADANESIARAKFPRLQRLADEIRAARHFAGRADPPDDANPKLGWVIPKGQLQTAASALRQPHRPQHVIDESVHAAAIRELDEETGGSVAAADLTLLADAPPLHFANYPPRKVEVFLAALRPDADCHPARRTSWSLPPNPETRRCQWMSVEQLLNYFAQPGVFDTTYTAVLVHQLIQRMGWDAQIEGYAPPQGRAAFGKAQQSQQPQQQPQQQQSHPTQPTQSAPSAAAALAAPLPASTGAAMSTSATNSADDLPISAAAAP